MKFIFIIMWANEWLKHNIILAYDIFLIIFWIALSIEISINLLGFFPGISS